MHIVPVMLFVLTVGMLMPVKATFNSVTVVSYNKLMKTQNGDVLCALDTANETTSSSSLEYCSLRCANDANCTGFNIKNSLTCDLYNYRPKINTILSACMFYQVNMPFLTYGTVFLARDSIYAIARYMPSPVRPSGRPSVCPSRGWISQRRFKIGSRNLHHRVAP